MSLKLQGTRIVAFHKVYSHSRAHIKPPTIFSKLLDYMVYKTIHVPFLILLCNKAPVIELDFFLVINSRLYAFFFVSVSVKNVMFVKRLNLTLPK